MMDRLPVFMVGLLLILTASGVVWWGGRGQDGVAKTGSDFSASPSLTATSTPTFSPTATPSATAMSTDAFSPADNVSPTEKDVSETETPLVEGSSWERALGGANRMEDLSTRVTPSSAATPVVHVVEEEDNLRIVATQYDRTVEAIAEANGIEIDSLLQIGQELVIPPPPEDAGEAKATPATHVHTVEEGDTLGSIAVLYDVSTEEIAEANGLRLDTTLQIDQELVIPLSEESEEDDVEISGTPTPAATEKATPTPTETPAPVIHTVEEGDTLGSIAVLYDVSTEEIAEANDLRLNALLQLDQELIIPGFAPTPTPGATSTPSPTSRATDA
ncbi:MAG: LysM peptidoglycan-binding domain-containing protein, partial [Anaerolineales bacterium]